MTAKASCVLAIPRTLMLTITLILLLKSNTNAVEAAGSFQNGRTDGALYAGGLDYFGEFIYITGITYGTNGGPPSKESTCFVSRFNFDKINDHEHTISSAIGDGSYMRSCNAVSLKRGDSHPTQKVKDFMVAGTDALSKDQPAGFITAHNPRERNHFRIDDEISTDLAGNTGAVSYPVSVLYTVDDVVYVASLSSTDLNANPYNKELIIASGNQPNWLKYRKYGSSFALSLQKFDAEPGSKDEKLSMSENWTKLYPLDVDNENSIKPDVFLAGMMIHNDGVEELLVVAGSTSGSGIGYGRAQAGSTDEDGFISVHNAKTGELVEGRKSNLRVGTAETDLILGICGDQTDPNTFYIVGSTGDGPGMGDQIENKSKGKPVVVTNEGSLHGFVQKRRIDTLEIVWGKYWSANKVPNDKDHPTITAGIACESLNDGTLYVAGIAEDGAHVIRDRKTDHIGDDIIAMKLDGETGEAQWITQFGSKDGDENLARSQAIAIDPEGNPVLFGETTGSLFRKRDDATDNTSDIFLATLSKEDGSHDSTVPGNQKGDWLEIIKNQEKGGMLSGGKWTEDEIYGSGEWMDKTAIGIQSGPGSGALFAGGMVYDDSEDTVYLTGITYDDNNSGSSSTQSSCMVTKLSEFTSFGGAESVMIGQNDVLEICNSVALHGYGEVVAIGSAGKGSTLLQNSNVQDYPMVGFAIALDRNNLEEVDTTPLVTTKPDARIQYPIDVLSDGNDMYIVSLTSTDSEKTKEFKHLLTANGGRNDFSPNWMNMKKYGTSFDMTVTKVTLQEEMIDGVPIGDIVFTIEWSKEFPVKPDDNNAGTIPRVFLGGAILKKSRGYLAVSGSTRGMGSGYGSAVGKDEDGFITLIDTNTGELSNSVTRNNIREGTPKDDIVLGMCHDPNDDSSLYIVGGTKGQMSNVTQMTEIPSGSTQAYLRKIDATNLAEVWTVQLGAVRNSNDESEGRMSVPTTVKAFDCAVSGDTIYAAGIVDDNAGIVVDNRPLNSRGGDDIWVGSFTVNSGHTNWVRQMGSTGNDHIAPRGGIVINKKGNALIFGDTNGEFYRQRSDDESELFLLEVKKNGSHKPHVKHQKLQYTLPPIANSGDGSPVTKEGGGNGIPTGVLVAVVVVGIMGALVLAFYVYRRMGLAGRGKSGDAQKIEVRDGLVRNDKNGTFSKAPPASSFQAGKAGMIHGGDDPLDGYSDNLKHSEGDIV